MKKILLSALLLLVAGVQTATAQGFRIYKSDGTIAQFSMRTDSIVFYEGIGTDQDFGLFTPANQMIEGTWYKSKTKTVSFNEDGTTDLEEGTTYEFMPYQGTIVLNNPAGRPVSIYKVHKLTDEMMVISRLDGYGFSTLTRDIPPLYVSSIELSDTKLVLKIDESKRLTATVKPDDADNPALKWSSSNSAVAEVNSSGRVTANGIGECIITCSSTDGSGVKAECEVVVDAHDYVDLGLPSGTLWATCNVGENAPGEGGDYFAWGETEPKENYNLATYKWAMGEMYTYTKYCPKDDLGYQGFTDDLVELEPEDDAATANWGKIWQTPSDNQFEELRNNTTTTYTTQNGVKGRLFVSNINGNSIFLPANGHATSQNNSSYGYYWSRTLDTTEVFQSWNFFFHDSSWGVTTEGRELGECVRPVRKASW